MFTLEFQKKILVKMVDTKGFKNLSVPVLSVATPPKQKDAWLPLHASAKPSTHQLTQKHLSNKIILQN